MSVSSELSKLGSGVGRIYLTDSSGTLTGLEFFNDKIGREAAEKAMVVSATLSSNISATSSVTITSAGGTITNLSYNGVSVFNTASPITGGTTTELATALALAINANVSTPSYTAISAGSDVIIYLDPDNGSSLNGTVAAFATTGTAAMTATNLDGGAYPTELVDAQIGYRVYINNSLTAPSASLVGATDITTGVLRKAASSPYSVKDVQISSGALSIDRDGAFTIVSVQTEGATASDDLTSINAGIFNDGDVVVLRGKESGKVTTVKEGGNIELANNADFLTATKDYAIMLQYSTSDNKWYEISRSPGNNLSVASLRSASISAPVQGVQATTLTTGGGSVTVQPGVDKGHIVLTGTGTLTGSWSYNLGGTPIDGDTFIVDYKGTFTPSGNNVTIFGVSLTDSQIAGEKVTVEATYILSSTSWSVVTVRDTAGVDLVDTTDLATKETGLGNPAANGYILSSTTGGVRSWIPSATDIAYDSDYTTTGNSAGVVTTLRSVSLPGNTLSSDGSCIVFKFTGQFGSNAGAKTFKVVFAGTDVLQNLNSTSPNGSDFTGEVVVVRSGSTVAKVSGSLQINGLPNEVNFSQVTSLNFTTTSYNLDITGIGAVSSDVNIYTTIATKIIF